MVLVEVLYLATSPHLKPVRLWLCKSQINLKVSLQVIDAERASRMRKAHRSTAQRAPISTFVQTAFPDWTEGFNAYQTCIYSILQTSPCIDYINKTVTVIAITLVRAKNGHFKQITSKQAAHSDQEQSHKCGDHILLLEIIMRSD